MNLQQVNSTPVKRQSFFALIVAPLFIAALLWASNGLAMQIEQSDAPHIACTGPCSDPGGGG